MKKFSELTPGGVKRRYRKVALIALEQYDIDVQELKFLTEETNIFYKVTDSSGERYALKIFQEESSTIDDNLAEVWFLKQIADDTSIPVPGVVESKNGENIIFIESEYTPMIKRAAVYRWLEGDDLDGRETPELFYKLGQTAAVLHGAAERFNIPKRLSPKKWDKVFYYNGEEPVYKDEKYQKFLSDEYHETMDFIIPFLDLELKKLYSRGEPHLIHADLNPWNVKILDGNIRLLDFEEAMLAYPVHDFAIMLFYYRYDPNFIYSDVKSAFFRGYESIKPLPDFSEYDLELLMTARRVNFLNYILLIDDDPTEYIQRSIPRVREFISNYISK